MFICTITLAANHNLTIYIFPLRNPNVFRRLDQGAKLYELDRFVIAI
jgi:hypothetical protein